MGSHRGRDGQLCLLVLHGLLGCPGGTTEGLKTFSYGFLNSHLNTAWGGVEICLRAVGRGIAADSVLM